MMTVTSDDRQQLRDNGGSMTKSSNGMGYLDLLQYYVYIYDDIVTSDDHQQPRDNGGSITESSNGTGHLDLLH